MYASTAGIFVVFTLVDAGFAAIVSGGADAFLLEISDANKLIYSKKFMNSSVFYDSDNLNAWEVWENSKRVRRTTPGSDL